LVWAPLCQAIPDGATQVPPVKALASGRPDAENEIGEVRLTGGAGMVAILDADRPVGQASLDAALWRIQRVTSLLALAEPYPRLSACLEHVQALVVAREYPHRVANVHFVAHA
jgi:hypothetical protein